MGSERRSEDVITYTTRMIMRLLTVRNEGHPSEFFEHPLVKEGATFYDNSISGKDQVDGENAPSELSICDGLQTKLFLELNNFRNGCVLDGLQLLGGALPRFVTLLRLFQDLRTEERADMLCSRRRRELNRGGHSSVGEEEG